VVRVTTPVVIAGHGGTTDVETADVYPVGSPQAASTSTLLSTLAKQRRPAASRGSGVQLLIGGQTAIFADFSSVLTSKLPLFIGVVVLLSFLLLTAVFRSLLIPAMAAVMKPAHGRRIVRRDHGGLPMGLARQLVRDRQERTNRSVRPG